jgi:SAM-dependent methyltransferase
MGRGRGLRVHVVSGVMKPTDAPDIYDRVAERYERHATDSLWNAHYDRPAVLSLLPDLHDRRVLDAGCGPGLYTAELIAGGAEVIAVDASAEMVRLTRLRVGDRAEVVHHDLNRPLGFMPDASIDVVVSALVWHYLDDRVGALREFHRVLVPGGHVVLSTHHPFDDWMRHGGNYFVVEPVVDHWSSLDTTFPTWRMPLTNLCGEFASAGFVIERLLEPQPVPAAEELDASEHERLSTRPGFIAFRLSAG